MQPYITISGVSLNLGWTLNKMVGFQHARRTSPMLQYCMSLHISEESKRMIRKLVIISFIICTFVEIINIIHFKVSVTKNRKQGKF